MSKLIVNQEGRHIINVPMPFTEEQLRLILTHCNGWENESSTVEDYLKYILEKGELSTNPSSEIGDGANVVDIFSYGLMVYMKVVHKMEIDPVICWWHPCAMERPIRIKSVEIEWGEVEIESDEVVITMALDSRTGEIVHAKDLEP